MISPLSNYKINNKYSINLISITLAVIVAEAAKPSSVIDQVFNECIENDFVEFDKDEISEFLQNLIEQGFVSVDQKSQKTKLSKSLNTILQTYGSMNSNYSYYLQ
jgi:hypothetical protein